MIILTLHPSQLRKRQLQEVVVEAIERKKETVEKGVR